MTTNTKERCENSAQTTNRNLKIDPIWYDYKENPTQEVRNQLIEKFYPLVRFTSERMLQKLPHNVELDDLISAGTFGLMDAIRGFDPDRGVKFETYCSLRVHGAILDELRSIDWVPRLVRTKGHQLDATISELEKRLGRPPSDGEMADHLGLSLGEFDKLVRESKAVSIVSLNEKWQDGSAAQSDNKALRKIDLVEDQKSEDPSEALQRKDVLDVATRCLTQKERLILILYYFEDLTLKEIGACLDLSESRVCQLHRKIMEKLEENFGGRKVELFF